MTAGRPPTTPALAAVGLNSGRPASQAWTSAGHGTHGAVDVAPRTVMESRLMIAATAAPCSKLTSPCSSVAIDQPSLSVNPIGILKAAEVNAVDDGAALELAGVGDDAGVESAGEPGGPPTPLLVG